MQEWLFIYGIAAITIALSLNSIFARLLELKMAAARAGSELACELQCKLPGVYVMNGLMLLSLHHVYMRMCPKCQDLLPPYAKSAGRAADFVVGLHYIK